MNNLNTFYELWIEILKLTLIEKLVWTLVLIVFFYIFSKLWKIAGIIGSGRY